MSEGLYSRSPSASLLYTFKNHSDIMRYERTTDYSTGLPRIATKAFLETQLNTNHAFIDVDEEGFKLRAKGWNEEVLILVINNDGLVAVNLNYARAFQKMVSTFFREVFGKNMLIIWRRGKTRVFIYPEGSGWKDDDAKRWSQSEDNKLAVAVFDLRLQPLHGLTKMAPLRKKDPVTRQYVKKTNSQW